MRYLLWLAVIALVLGSSCSASAQGELAVIAPGGARTAMEQLISGFESKTGYKVKAIFGSGMGTN